MVQDPKLAPTVTKDEWTLIFKKGKGAAKPNPSSQESNHPSSSITPLMPTTPKVTMVVPPPISNPVSEGIEQSKVQAGWVRVPQVASMISSSFLHRSHSLEGQNLVTISGVK